MAPLAAVQSLIFAIIAGELPTLSEALTERTHNWTFWSSIATIAYLLGNGILAFVLNVSSFQANKMAGALVITVAGNLKQALTLALGIVLFHDYEINILNGLGIFTVLFGCAFFSKAELDSKAKRTTS